MQFQISDIRVETLGQGSDAEQKGVLYFQGVDRGLVLNKTNANIIVDSYGQETDNWRGQWIELRVERVQFKDKMVDGLRLRCLPQTAQQAAPAPVQQPPQGFPPFAIPPQGGAAGSYPPPGTPGLPQNPMAPARQPGRDFYPSEPVAPPQPAQPPQGVAPVAPPTQDPNKMPWEG